MMKVKLLASVAMAGLLAAGAAAAEPNGWYGAIDAGYHTLGDVETSRKPRAAFDIATEGDWAAFARLGYRFDQNWRVELEGGYRQNDIELIDRPGPGGVPSGVCNVVRPRAPATLRTASSRPPP
jgi:OOP family OmpA-OmpF porin